MPLFIPLDSNDVPVFETFVVPRFLRLFSDFAIEMMIPTEGAVIAHLGCRTGEPSASLTEVFPNVSVLGLDASPAALELAQTKSALIRGARFEYQVVSELPVPVDGESFSHCMTVYPLMANQQEWQSLADEASRLLAPGGQVVWAMPLRGSYPELYDMLREYALKVDESWAATLADGSARAKPSVEHVGDYFESAGLIDVDVDIRLVKIPFRSGRDFVEDPIVRLLLLPELRLLAGDGDLDSAMAYIREAVDLYWSESEFTLSLNIGAASARKPMD